MINDSWRPGYLANIKPEDVNSTSARICFVRQEINQAIRELIDTLSVGVAALKLSAAFCLELRYWWSAIASRFEVANGMLTIKRQVTFMHHPYSSLDQLTAALLDATDMAVA